MQRPYLKEPPHTATYHTAPTRSCSQTSPMLEHLEVMRPVPNVTKRETEAQRKQWLGQGHRVELCRAKRRSQVSVHCGLSFPNCLESTGCLGASSASARAPQK